MFLILFWLIISMCAHMCVMCVYECVRKREHLVLVHVEVI